MPFAKRAPGFFYSIRGIETKIFFFYLDEKRLYNSVMVEIDQIDFFVQLCCIQRDVMNIYYLRQCMIIISIHSDESLSAGIQRKEASAECSLFVNIRISFSI